MAGSYEHCENDDGTYRGPELCENLGDCYEAIEQMFFMTNWLARENGFGWDKVKREEKIRIASDAYFRCARREEPWPDFMGEMARV